MKRNKYQILILILKLIKTPQHKTDIVYKCNLNFTLARKYLDILGFNNCFYIKENKYHITENGLILLEKLKLIENDYNLS